MVLFAPKTFKLDSPLASMPVRNVVHFELYEKKTKRLDDLLKGRANPMKYLALFLRSMFVYFIFTIKNRLRRKINKR